MHICIIQQFSEWTDFVSKNIVLDSYRDNPDMIWLTEDLFYSKNTILLRFKDEVYV